MKKTTIAKAALVLAVLIVIAAFSALMQKILLGRHNVAVTSAVVSISAFSLWRLLWKPAQ